MSNLEDTLAWQLKVAGYPPPVREYRFYEKRRWRFDLCWPEQKVAVEVQGEGHRDKRTGLWIPGRHLRTSGLREDCKKLCVAAMMGYRVLPVTARMIKNGTALNAIGVCLAIESFRDYVFG